MRRIAGILALSAILFQSCPTCAQISTTVTLLSDYRFRGASLTDGDPALQAAFNVDAGSGLYAGALASSSRIRTFRATAPPYPAYGSTGGYEAINLSGLATQYCAGYARSFAEGKTWELGAIRYRYPHESNTSNYDYSELFAGLSSDFWSVRAYTSHKYYGIAGRSIYLELSLAQPLQPGIKLVGHVGYLGLHSGPSLAGVSRSSHRLDFKAALDFRFEGGRVELGVVGTGLADNQCLAGPDRCRTRAVASLSHEF